jgi:hypothetical protein
MSTSSKRHHRSRESKERPRKSGCCVFCLSDLPIPQQFCSSFSFLPFIFLSFFLSFFHPFPSPTYLLIIREKKKKKKKKKKEEKDNLSSHSRIYTPNFSRLKFEAKHEPYELPNEKMKQIRKKNKEPKKKSNRQKKKKQNKYFSHVKCGHVCVCVVFLKLG